MLLKVCLHVTSTCPSPCPSPSKFNIVPMVTGSLTDRLGVQPIQPVRVPVTIGTMLNFAGHGDVTCKQTLRLPWLREIQGIGMFIFQNRKDMEFAKNALADSFGVSCFMYSLGA